MNIRFHLISTLSALCVASSLYAGDRNSAKVKNEDSSFELAYSYGHALEFNGGFATTTILAGGELHNALAGFAGSCSQLRYSCFVSRHWGFYLSLSSQALSSGTTPFLRAMNYADGGIYKYASDYSSYILMASLSNVMAGAVYRYDFGNCSLRPRLGIGVGSYVLMSGGYKRYSRNDPSAFPQYITYSIEEKKQDFLVGSDSEIHSYADNLAFVTSLSCQFCYTFRRSFFISAEVGLSAAFQPGVSMKQRTYQAESAYNPDNWADAVMDYDRRDAYVFTTYTEAPARIPWAFFNVSVGVGWNIGFNRRK